MRTTLNISSKSWHGKLYNFWRQHAIIKKNNYKENLCHYVRVILFWALLSLFINATFKYNWLRPVTIFLGVTIPATIAIMVVLFTGPFLLVLLWTVIVIVGLLTCSYLLYLIDQHQDMASIIGNKILTIIGIVTVPFWGSFYLFYLLGKLVSKPLAHIIFEYKKFQLYVFEVVLLAIYGIAVFLFTSTVILWTAYIVGGALALLGILTCGIYIYDYLSSRPSKEKIKDDGIVKVGWHYVVAKKHRVCPLIDIRP